MIFVFDVSSKESQADMHSFASTIRALREYSPNSKLFILIHKMDLIPMDQKDKTFQEHANEVGSICKEEGFRPEQLDFSPTSIWDQSLYRAWTKVIYYLVPNAVGIESLLQRLADMLDAREMILYERTTCLVVTHISRGMHKKNPYADRFERISSILKQHKHSMAKHTGMMASETSFAEMQVKTKTFMLFITRLTENTNLAVVMPNDEGAFNTARVNVQLVKKEFAHLDIVDKKGKDNSRPAKDGDVANDNPKASDEGDISA